MIVLDKEKALKFYIVLSRAYDAISKADKKEIEKYGISSSEFAVLELLYSKGPQPIQYIASKVLLKSGSMTYVIGQLEKKELLKRVVCEEDRRIYYAYLTLEGEKLIKEIFPIHEDFLYNLLNVLPEKEIDQLIENLKFLGKTVKKEGK